VLPHVDARIHDSHPLKDNKSDKKVLIASMDIYDPPQNHLALSWTIPHGVGKRRLLEWKFSKGNPLPSALYPLTSTLQMIIDYALVAHISTEL
jgi:hypothetical protein